MGWQDMKDAPLDRIIIARVGKRRFPIKWEGGFLNEGGDECACWVATEEDNHPVCWDDGVCWASNANGVQSRYPEAWQEKANA